MPKLPKTKLCKECAEPMEDQTTHKRICEDCRLDREIEKEERREERKQLAAERE